MEGYLKSPALGEESLQMWNLNKRLEAYLSRVKSLEDENELLRAEIHSLKGTQVERSWRNKYDDELNALRDTLNESFSEKHQVEQERDSLVDEIELVKSKCQQERQAQEDAKQDLADCKKVLEEERRAQIWLKEKTVQLENELEALVEVHEADRAELEQEMASFSQSMDNFRVAPAAFHPVDIEDYSKRLSEVWKGAVENYKSEVSSLESTLTESKEKLRKVTEENKQNQAQTQDLEKELLGLKRRKEMLEERLSKEWQNQQEDVERFQVDIESLEQEKQDLRVQIAHVLEDRQQLMHLKMSLSLEVATYRSLLEAESTRLHMPLTDYKQASPFRDSRLEFSSSPIQAMSADARTFATREPRSSLSPFQKGENRTPLQKTQHNFQSFKTTTVAKSPRPVTVEAPKSRLQFQSQNLTYTSGMGLQKDTPVTKTKTITPISLMSEEIRTGIKVERLSNSVSSHLSKSSAVLESDISGKADRLTDSRTEQQPEATGDKMTEQQEPKEVSREELQEKLTENDHIIDAKSGNEEPPIQEALYTNQLLVETLEDIEKKVEDAGELIATNMLLTNSEPSLFKAMGATFDIPSNDTQPEESYGPDPPHVEAPLKAAVKKDEMEKHIENGEQADKSDTFTETDVSKDTSSDQVLHLEEPAVEAETVELNNVKSTLFENAEEAVTEQNINRTNQVSDIPITGEMFVNDGQQEILSAKDTECEKEELELLSKETGEDSDMIVEHVDHRLATDLQICPEAELDGDTVSDNGQDIPKDIEVNIEESAIQEPNTEVLVVAVQSINEETQVSNIPNAGEMIVSDVQEKILSVKNTECEQEELELISKETKEASDMIVEHVNHLSVTDLQICPEAELDGDKVSGNEQDVARGIEGNTEESHVLESDTEDSEIRVLQMTEEENMRELASAAEDTEDYDVVSDVQEGIFFKTESSAEGAELKEVLPNEMREPDVPDQLMFEQEEREEEKLTDENDLTEGQEHDDWVEMITEHEILNVRISQNLSVKENVAELTTHNLIEEGNEGTDNEHDIWKHEALSAAEKIVQPENLNVEESNFEDETETVKENVFEQDNLGQEQNEVEESDVTQEAVGGEQEHEENGQGGPLAVESESVSMTQSETEHSKTETTVEVMSQGPTWGDDVISSTEEKDSNSEWANKLDSDMRKVTGEEESENVLKVEHLTEQSEHVKDYESGSALVQKDFSEEDLDTKEEQQDSENNIAPPSQEASSQEIVEDETEASPELQGSEDHNTEIPQSFGLQESVEEHEAPVEHLIEQSELGQDYESDSNLVQKDLPEEDLETSEERQDSGNSFAPPTKDTTNQEIIEDDTEASLELQEAEDHNAEVPKGFEDHESVEEQKASESCTTAPGVYQTQSEYSESEDSFDSQHELSQHVSQNETRDIAKKEIENSKDCLLEQTLPDTTPLPSYEDETEELTLEMKDSVEVVTQVSKETEVFLREADTVELVTSAEEFPVGSKDTLQQVETEFNKTAPEKEDISTVEMSFIKSTDGLEENILAVSNQDILDSEASNLITYFEESELLTNVQDDQDMFDGHDATERETQGLELETSTNTVTLSKQVEEHFEDVAEESAEDVIEESEDMKSSEVTAVDQEVIKCDEAVFILKSEQNVDSTESDSLAFAEGTLEIDNENTFELNARCVEAVEPHAASSLVTPDIAIVNENQTDNDNQKPEVGNSDSDDSISSDEESPNVTKTANESEHEVSKTVTSDLSMDNGQVNESCVDVHVSSKSQELEEMSLFENGTNSVAEQVISTHEGVVSDHNITDLSTEVGQPPQTEGLASDQHQEIEAEDSSDSADDVLMETCDTDNLEEQFVINPENFLLNPLQFTSEGQFSVESNADGLNGLHDNHNINDLPEFTKEMVNGHSNLKESQEVDTIHQKSKEQLESGITSLPESEPLEKTAFIQESYAEEMFPFPKSEVSGGLFQKRLEMSNEKESPRVEEDQAMSSDEDQPHQDSEEQSSEEDYNGDASVQPHPYAKGKGVDEQHQMISKNTSFEDGQIHLAPDQHRSETLEVRSGLKGLHDDACWSSDED